MGNQTPVYFVDAAMFHCNGWVANPWTVTWPLAGVHVFPCAGWNPQKIVLNLIHDHRRLTPKPVRRTYRPQRAW